MVSTGAWLIVLTLLAAAFLVAHLALLVGVWRKQAVPVRERWLALVPLLLPVIAFRGGAKVGATLWLVLLTSYLVLRFLG